MGEVKDIAMFMLYITVLGIVLVNADQFATVVSAIGSTWTNSLKVLQVRA